MPLPRNVRPNPYQPLADEQWAATARAQMVTPQQGFNPRGAVGRPAAVAHSALLADDIAYGQMPVQAGVWATNWQAAANAKAAEASQTLQLHGMLGAAYGRRSGTGVRELRVRRIPVSGLGSVGNVYMPSSALHAGAAAHYRGLGSVSDRLPQYAGEAGVAACAAPDSDLVAAVGAMLATAPFGTESDATSKVLDSLGVVFGEDEALCALLQLNKVVKEAPETLQTVGKEFQSFLTAAGAARFGQLYGILLTYLGCNKDVACTERALKAGQKMTSKGWWEKDKWEFRWKYLSGYTLWYKNPLYLGGGAVGGLVLYSVAKKKKRGRR